MNWFQRLLRRERLERDLDAELQLHVDRLVAEHRAAGLGEKEARRRALAGATGRSRRPDCRASLRRLKRHAFRRTVGVMWPLLTTRLRGAVTGLAARSLSAVLERGSSS